MQFNRNNKQSISIQMRYAKFKFESSYLSGKLYNEN